MKLMVVKVIFEFLLVLNNRVFRIRVNYVSLPLRYSHFFLDLFGNFFTKIC